MRSVHAAALRTFGCPGQCAGIPTVTPGLSRPGRRSGTPRRVRALDSGEFACRVVGGGAELT
jgi:hypothetical protein